MSDTPRTDLLDGLYLYSDDQACALAMADHARTLERELAAEQAKVARLREALTETLEEGICWYGDCRGGNPDDLGWVQRARAALKDTDG